MNEQRDNPTPNMNDYPAEWLQGNQLDEVAFCEMFLENHPMKNVNGVFFTVEGRIYDENKLKKEIYDLLKPHFTTGLTKRTATLLDAIRMECYAPDLPIHNDRIHVQNGTLFLNGHFTEDKEYCRNRLPVAYHPSTPLPQTWLRFLSQLLEPEDIITLQEFMGYCLLPTTKGQKMLMLVGRGGEGKSRVGLVLRALFGESLKHCNLSTIPKRAQKSRLPEVAKKDIDNLD